MQSAKDPECEGCSKRPDGACDDCLKVAKVALVLVNPRGPVPAFIKQKVLARLVTETLTEALRKFLKKEK